MARTIQHSVHCGQVHREIGQEYGGRLATAFTRQHQQVVFHLWHQTKGLGKVYHWVIKHGLVQLVVPPFVPLACPEASLVFTCILFPCMLDLLHGSCKESTPVIASLTLL